MKNLEFLNKLTVLGLILACIAFVVCNASAQNSTFVQQAKLTASDGAAQDSHGFAVTISGDTAVVGAPRNTGGSGLQSRGSVYVYVRNTTTGAWTFQQKLAPSDSVAADQFGYAVAISGGTIAVGRYNTTTGLNRADGKVYIFTRTGTTWAETQTIQSSDIAQGDLFGSALAFENDTLVVGALGKNNGNNFFQGAAYVFTRAGGAGAFTQQAKLTSSDGVLFDFFGYSVAVSGDSVVVGATSQAGQPNSKGKAYVFTRSGAAWTQQQILQASDGANGDAFGFAVGISGNTAIIGARLDVVGTMGELGSAYVFNRSGAVWTEAQKLTAAEATPRNDAFGSSVAIRGDIIAIGSPAHEFVPSIANHGAVYVFQRAASGGNFTRTGKLVHSDVAPDALGTSVAFDGSSIISGAPSKDSARGASYIFGSLGANIQKIIDAEGATDDQFGSDVAVSGDTMVVSSREDQIGTNLRQGSASVYVKNSAGGWVFQQKLVAADGARDDLLGDQNSVAIEGDTIVLGAALEDSGATFDNGAVYVFTRSNGVWTQRAKLLASDPTTSSFFGKATAISGGTIVVGASGYATGVANRGAIYVFTGAGATWTEQARIVAADAAANDNLGTDVQITGNTVFAAAEGVNSGRGAVYVINRTGATWTQAQKLLASNGASQDQFGSAVAVRGDEAMIGARKGGTQDSGAVYYYVREGGAWIERQIILPTDAASSSAEFGESVDFNGTTAIIGAEFDALPTGVSLSGAAYIFRKTGETWTQAQKFVPIDAQSSVSLGRNVALSGERGIVTASAMRVNGQNAAGAVYVFDTGSVKSAFDFDGDGRADVSVFRPSNGAWYLLNSNTGFAGATFGQSGDKIAPADFDGDGKTDLAVFRNGVWYLQRSSQGFTGIQFGTTDDIPVPADFDGDGKADIAVFRPSNGTWYRLNSSNGQFAANQFGQSGDNPTVGDFDGDGKTDIAVFRSSNGTWYRLNSSNGSFVGTQFGQSGDLVVPADYDGDGKTDVAVFRPSNGTWYRFNSSNGQFVGIQFGQAGDKPSPADFDGDGKADLAVYRGGNWYILQSSNNGFAAVNFGQTDDLPTPNFIVR